jgi:hypothetical protein
MANPKGGGVVSRIDLDSPKLRALAVPLKPAARKRLEEIARAERRSPRQQAAIMLERLLLFEADKA